MGITGRIHGDNIDAIPARNESKGPISILFPFNLIRLNFSYKVKI